MHSHQLTSHEFLKKSSAQYPGVECEEDEGEGKKLQEEKGLSQFELQQDKLPAEVWEQIFDAVEAPRDLMNIRSTCRFFRAIQSNDGRRQEIFSQYKIKEVLKDINIAIFVMKFPNNNIAIATKHKGFLQIYYTISIYTPDFKLLKKVPTAFRNKLFQMHALNDEYLAVFGNTAHGEDQWHLLNVTTAKITPPNNSSILPESPFYKNDSPNIEATILGGQNLYENKKLIVSNKAGLPLLTINLPQARHYGSVPSAIVLSNELILYGYNSPYYAQIFAITLNPKLQLESNLYSRPRSIRL